MVRRIQRRGGRADFNVGAAADLRHVPDDVSKDTVASLEGVEPDASREAACLLTAASLGKMEGHDEDPEELDATSRKSAGDESHTQLLPVLM